MASLADYLYTADLVRRIQAGNETAFGELYLTTYPDIYHFCFEYLQQDISAQKALELTYTNAMKNIGQLRDPSLITTWLYKLAFQACHSIRPDKSWVNVDGKTHLVGNILNLPFTESQVILMTYYMKMKEKDIAKQLRLDKRIIRRYLNLGKQHLAQLQV